MYKSKIQERNRCKLMKNNRGITLISLVVTIIVLIILVAVSINLILGENGLIKRSQTGARDYDKASIIETVRDDIYAKQTDKLASGQTGKLTEAEFNEILEKHGTVNGENFKPDGKDFEIPKVEIYNEGFATGETNQYAGIKIGDYVDYSPASNTYTALATATGYATNQTFTTFANTKWQVMNITENTMTLISEKPIGPEWCGGDGVNGTELSLKGAKGYNNAEYILNEMCKNLYSKDGVGIARNMNWDDVQKLTNWANLTSEQKLKILIETMGEWTEANYYDTRECKYIPDSTSPDGYSSNNSPYTVTNDWDVVQSEWLTSENGFSDVSPVKTSLVFGTNDDWFYWLSSTGIVCAPESDWSSFYGGVVASYEASTGYNANLFSSNATTYSESTQSQGFRPVVTLSSGIQIEESTGTRDYPHHIK